MRVLILATLTGMLPGFGDDYVKPQPEAIRTERMDFEPGGLIRLDHSYGDLFLEGWDRPEIQIIVTKSIRYKYASADSERAAQRLESVEVVAGRRSPTEFAISTKLASRSGRFSPPLPRTALAGVGLEYRINAPRNSRLSIHHGDGQILIRDITGDIAASCTICDMTLWLASMGQYSIDARSRGGTVTSEFTGSKHSHYLFGQTFVSASPGPAQRILLRVGFGGIQIQPILSKSESSPDVK